MRPLLSIQETRMSKAMGEPKREVPKKTYETPPHSRYGAERSRSYEDGIKRLNPSKTLPAKRLFPGLAN